MHIAGYRSQAPSFTERQRRIARGIAQLASMALTNAQLVEELERASRLKSEFVSTMSHELRTPLNVILGFTEIARDTALDGPERERALERVDVAARELFSLIEDTLEMGGIEWSRDAVRLQQMPLRSLLGELERACVRLPRADAVGFRWKVDVPDASVLIDPRKLTVLVKVRPPAKVEQTFTELASATRVVLPDSASASSSRRVRCGSGMGASAFQRVSETGSERCIGVDLVSELLPARGRVVLARVLAFLGLAVCLYLAWEGLQLTVEAWHKGERSGSMWNPPRWPFFALMPAGLGLTALQYVA